MRRIALVLVLLLAASIGAAASGRARGSTAPAAAPVSGLRADFNHDGAEDLAVGVPNEDVGTIENAGVVNVLYGSAGGLSGIGSRLFTQAGGAAEPNDGFGEALAVGDFNHDGFADLAASAPTESLAGIPFAGAVSVLYGSAGGLTRTGSRLFTQAGDPPEPDDLFGASLAVGDFNHDGFADLAAGAWLEQVGDAVGAGAVSVLYGSPRGLTRSGSRLFTQVGDPPERVDEFGYALTAGDFNHDGFADLAASAPLEDVGSVEDAGAVSVLYGSPRGLTRSGSRLFTQVGGTPEFFDQFGAALATGDFNHDGFADLTAGAPLEQIGTASAAGAVSVLYGSARGLTRTGSRLLTEGGSAAESSDQFGAALATGDFNRDGFADLAAGAPAESLAGIAFAGAVSVLYGSTRGLTRTGSRLFSEAGRVENADRFGAAVAVGDFNRDGFADLAGGAPLEDVGTIENAGAVSVLYGTAGGLTRTGRQLFTQNSRGVPSSAEENDLFGHALAAGRLGVPRQ